MNKDKLPDMQLNLIEYNIDHTVKRESINLTHEQAQKLIWFIGVDNASYEKGNFMMWLTASLNKEEALEAQKKYLPNP